MHLVIIRLEGLGWEVKVLLGVLELLRILIMGWEYTIKDFVVILFIKSMVIRDYEQDRFSFILFLNHNNRYNKRVTVQVMYDINVSFRDRI